MRVDKDETCFQTQLFEYTPPGKSANLFNEILLYFTICIPKKPKKFLKILGAFSLMKISRQDISQSSDMALLA